ncbi:hypothetical protein BH24ACI4_BH24ACI4_24250 [soil metagenome]
MIHLPGMGGFVQGVMLPAYCAVPRLPWTSGRAFRVRDMEPSEVRRRVRTAIEAARKEAHERRSRSEEAVRAYEEFLRARAAPVFHVLASALVAEGHRFKVFTPADTVRLVSESASEDFIELMLDRSSDPPSVSGLVSRGRGRRLVTAERPVAEGKPIAEITEEDVLGFLIDEITPFVA